MEPVTPDAPPAIAVVRDFVNTTDRETGVDEIASQAELTRWLVARDLMPRASRATAADHEAAFRLRAGLRRALEVNHDGGPAALPELAAVLADQPVSLTWTTEGAALTTEAAGIRGALARIAIAAHTATTDGTWPRLKICSWDECEWAYYDHSKNRSRHWCEYGCGNKVKTRAYRARKAATR
ncbi:CGNR zinc finger domain-containing protein [Nocardioides sp. GXQ0305]|uniref:CGNR zinc finger domain-containing protein n=1 Tax=Nocardioides sp. GXQ0305 TaxID=3423912 RepID=UPI003D7E4AAA